MRETLFALMALLIVTFLSFNQKQAQLHSQEQVVQEEFEQMAINQAEEAMSVIRANGLSYADSVEELPSTFELNGSADTIDFSITEVDEEPFEGETSVTIKITHPQIRPEIRPDTLHTLRYSEVISEFQDEAAD